MLEPARFRFRLTRASAVNCSHAACLVQCRNGASPSGGSKRCAFSIKLDSAAYPKRTTGIGSGDPRLAPDGVPLPNPFLILAPPKCPPPESAAASVLGQPPSIGHTGETSSIRRHCTTLGRPLVSPGFTGCWGSPTGASARASLARGGGRRFSKKNPPLATGCSLGRNGKVSRFASALCVAIHTRRGKLIPARV